MSKRSKRRSNRISKNGRPRKDGDRYPGGKLKLPPQNEHLLAQRANGAGFHPLQFAQMKGLITERQCRSGMSFAAAYGAAGFRVGGGSSGSSIETTPTDGEIILGKLSLMPDTFIQEVWDRVSPRFEGVADRDSRAAKAMARWRDLNDKVTPAQRMELFRVCVQAEWPAWIRPLVPAEGQPALDPATVLSRGQIESRRLLLAGLDALSAPKTGKAPANAVTIEPVPVSRTSSAAKRVVHEVAVINPEGELIRTVEYVQGKGR